MLWLDAIMMTIMNIAALRAIVHLSFGALYGGVLYLIIIDDLGFDAEFTTVLTVLVTSVIAVGNAMSKYVRCLCLLTLPNFCGKTGRSILKTMALALVITGPFANVMVNVSEVVRVFGCTSQLAYNLTKTRYALLVEPFQEALVELKHDGRQISDTLDSIQDIIEPVINEVEGEEEVSKLKEENDYIDNAEGDSLRSEEIEKKYKDVHERKRNVMNDSHSSEEHFEMEYKRKLEYRCEGVVSEASGKCREMFQGTYDKCYGAVSAAAAWLICWPMKLTFMCNLVTVIGGKTLCDPNKVVEPGFGAQYSDLKNTKSKLSEALGDVKIKFVMRGKLPKINTKGVAESAHSTMREFKRIKVYYDTVILVIQRAVAFVIIVIIYKAASYQDKYLTDIFFENNYITGDFLRIDKRRKEEGHRFLLPLKKIEQKRFINPRSFLPNRKEIGRLIKMSFLIILEMVPATTIFLLDFMLYTILDIIGRNAEVEFTQKGSHDINIEVGGGGVVANLVRSLLSGFNVKRDVHVVHSNAACLPKPTQLPNYFISKVYFLYFAVWLMILCDSYFQRLNRFICAYFYAKREKQRIIFLYNDTMRRRLSFIRDVMMDLESKARTAELEKVSNVFLSLRLRKPKLFGWLRYFPCAKLQCLICSEPEPWRKGRFDECVRCQSSYCLDCWNDFHENCQLCFKRNRSSITE